MQIFTYLSKRLDIDRDMVNYDVPKKSPTMLKHWFIFISRAMGYSTISIASFLSMTHGNCIHSTNSIMNQFDVYSNTKALFFSLSAELELHQYIPEIIQSDFKSFLIENLINNTKYQSLHSQTLKSFIYDIQ